MLDRGTIAQACGETGINRQQFNKYLAGQMLPGARTMRKICDYLGVSEARLMSGQPETGAARPRSPTFEPMLQDGFYRAYFAINDHPEHLEGWLLHVRSEPDGTQIHSYRTHFRNAEVQGIANGYLIYRGPVTYSRERATLISIIHSPRLMNSVTFVNLRPFQGLDYFSTTSLAVRKYEMISVSGAMRFLGHDCAGRQALAGLGVIRLDDPALDPVIAHMMIAERAWFKSSIEKNLRAKSGGSHLPEAPAELRLQA